MGAEGLGLQVPPHLVLPRAGQPPLTHLRPLHLLGKAVPIHTYKVGLACKDDSTIQLVTGQDRRVVLPWVQGIGMLLSGKQ